MSKITASARGENCQVRIPGVCRHQRDTVVWGHGNGSAADKGMGMKAPDLLGAYICFLCHGVYDRSIPTDLPRVEVELCFWDGHARSVVILFEKGIIRVERGTVMVQQ